MNEVELQGSQRRWQEWVILGLVAAVAFAIRACYSYTTIVDDPLRGDAMQYLIYGINLVKHHVFSGANYHLAMPPPDTYRDPGYPALLAILGTLLGWGDTFYRATLVTQALLSAATVVCFGVLARNLLSFRAGLAVAITLAFWPHLISLSGYLLSETLTGAWIGAALLASEAALRRRSRTLAIIAGLCFAGAGLTNAVYAPFAPLFAIVALWRDPPQRRVWAWLLVAAVLPLAAWSIRNALVPGSSSTGSRAAINFVQGSWPEYHDRYAFKDQDAEAARTMAEIDAEFQRVQASPAEGLRAVGRRLLSSPGHYLAWYLKKPLELWGWDIGIGQGDVYVFPTVHSLLVVNPVLRATTGVIFMAAPVILLAAFAGMILGLAGWYREHFAAGMAAALAFYATLVYTVLQADARYTTPLRGVEVLLAAVALSALLRGLKARRESLNQQEKIAP